MFQYKSSLVNNKDIQFKHITPIKKKQSDHSDVDFLV
jgi:hypothetical protein